MALSYQSSYKRKLTLMSLRKLFKSHGDFCATQPWEVIVATLTFLVCVLTAFNKHFGQRQNLGDVMPPATTHFNLNQGVCQMDMKMACMDHQAIIDTSFSPGNFNLIEFVIVMIFRALALFHVFYRFKKIHSMKSSLILKIGSCYLGFVLGIFLLVVISLGPPEGTIVFDSICLILLLIDLPKVTRMAQFALSSSHHQRVAENIAHGMFVLAPTLTLNTLSTTLLMGTGSLTGLHRLEQMSQYAIVYNLVNFFVYVTFYPAGLSLILELMYGSDGRPQWDVRQIINTLPKEDSQSPVVHHVRVIATSILVILHFLCRWPFVNPPAKEGIFYIYPWILGNIEQVSLVLAVLFVGMKNLLKYEDMDEALEMRRTYIEELTREFAKDSEQEADRASNSTDEGISIGRSSKESRPQDRTLNNIQTDDSSSESAWSELYGPDLKDQEAQTVDNAYDLLEEDCNSKDQLEKRSLQDCVKLSKTSHGLAQLSDDEIVNLVEAKHIRSHSLEVVLGDFLRGVKVRRKCTLRQANLKPDCLDNLPFLNYNYEKVMGACAESVIGYMTIPLGVVGPLKLDNKEFIVPMATTEGCLVASTNRGCSALRSCGVTSRLTEDGMTRAPVLRFPGIVQATEAQAWMKVPENFKLIKQCFDSTSRFARLKRIDVHPAGRSLYVRFVSTSGDAMGMNMLSKATEHALLMMQDIFPVMQIVSLSGNLCTDKKPAAINWIEGRGKSVVCEAVIPAKIVETTLKTSAAALCDLNIAKNLTGSALAGSIGGFNAHAANIVTAIFVATGQDAAQNVGSSNCITQMEPWGEDGRDLYITVTMPSIEVGTVGGGTILSAQGACLEMLGIKGSHSTSPGENSQQLAKIVCATVLAGELSLMSALAAGHLVKSHLKHNRSTNKFEPFPTTTPVLTTTTTTTTTSDKMDCESEPNFKSCVV